MQQGIFLHVIPVCIIAPCLLLALFPDRFVLETNYSILKFIELFFLYLIYFLKLSFNKSSYIIWILFACCCVSYSFPSKLINVKILTYQWQNLNSLVTKSKLINHKIHTHQWQKLNSSITKSKLSNDKY